MLCVKIKIEYSHFHIWYNLKQKKIGKNEESEDIGEFNNGNAFVEDDYDALNEETFASNFGKLRRDLIF